MAKSHTHENLIYICNAVLIPSCFLLFLFSSIKVEKFLSRGTQGTSERSESGEKGELVGV